jgi:hypothetical protein
MITKPSISFLRNDTDAKLITDSRGIVADMTDNPHYPTPTPTLAVVTTAINDFETAVTNAEDGGKTLTAIKREKRAALEQLMRQLASYVQVACNGDMAALLSSGFPVQKPTREPIGVLQAPANLTVTFGPRSGELRASAEPVNGAGIYNWQLSTAANPAQLIQTLQTTAASNTFTGLTPGVVYQVVVNAVGSAGPSDWSDPISQMAV